MTGLAAAGVHAVKWSAFATLARFLLQLGAQVVLARMLGPDSYGVFGISLLVLSLTGFLSNFGFGWNLMHKRDLTTEDIRFAATWQVLTGTVAMLVLLLAAPWLADYFHDPRVTPVIRWLSLTCFLGAAASASSNLLQRDLNFRAIGLIQIGSYACGYIAVGIPMAYAGAGVQALVAAVVVQALVVTLASFALRPHTLLPLLHYPGMAKAMGIGGTVFMTNITNWALNNMDRVFLGRTLNANAVGLYSVGYNIATMPNSLLLNALQPAFMSAAARMQSDPERLGRVYLQMMGTICVLVVPFFVFLAAISADLVRFLYGARWSGTGAVMAILFLGMPALVAWGLSTPVLWNTGRKHHEAFLQIPILMLGAAGFYAFTSLGVVAVATIASLMLLGRMLVICGSAFLVLKLSPALLLPQIARGLFLSALCATVVWSCTWFIGPDHQPFFTLALSGLATLGSLLIVTFFWPAILGEYASGMLLRFIPGLSGYLQPYPESAP
jgi:O-antigen/teichoic acid export membrane protein